MFQYIMTKRCLKENKDPKYERMRKEITALLHEWESPMTD